MKDADLSHELICLLDQSITMMRQEVVTVRNDMMFVRLGLQKLELQVDAIGVELEAREKERKQDASNRTSIIVGIGAALIAALSSLAVALIEHFKE